MRTGGWRYEIKGTDWPALLDRYRDVSPPVQPFADIVASVVESEAASELGYATSMWDLIVTPIPVVSLPVDVVVVRGESGVGKVRPGHVRIEHLPLVGLEDSIERPVSEAVPLFWRFIREKYGITPRRPTG